MEKWLLVGERQDTPLGPRLRFLLTGPGDRLAEHGLDEDPRKRDIILGGGNG